MNWINFYGRLVHDTARIRSGFKTINCLFQVFQVFRQCTNVFFDLRVEGIFKNQKFKLNKIKFYLAVFSI